MLYYGADLTPSDGELVRTSGVSANTTLPYTAGSQAKFVFVLDAENYLSTVDII